jgi:anti-anti-sigma factor
MSFRQPPLVISRGKALDHTLVIVSGELDLNTAPRLREAVHEALSEGPPTVHLDLSKVSFIDCAGLQALIICQRNARLRGGELLLRRTSAQVDRLRDLTAVHFDLVRE